MEQHSAPVVEILKVEYITNNHVDLSEVLHRLRRIEIRVAQDTAAEEALAAQNEDLRKQLEDLLTGETLPPAVEEKIKTIVAKIREGKEALTKAVTENTPT